MIEDDTALLEDTLLDAIDIQQPAVLSSREWNIFKTINIPSCEGLEVQGVSLYGTRLVWRGDDMTMFDRPNSRDHWWHNLTIDVQGPLGAAFIDRNDNFAKHDPRHVPGMIIPTANKHERMRVMGNQRLGIYRKYALGNCDENNEHHVDVEVNVNGTVRGWEIHGSQSKYHVIERCHYFGGDVKGQAMVHAYHGSFSAIDCHATHARHAAFVAENQADTLHLVRCEAETCAAFAEITGPNGGATGASQPVEITGGRFMCDSINEQLQAITLATAGPFTMRAFQLGNGTQKIGRVLMRGPRGMLDIKGCSFGSYGSDRANSVIHGDAHQVSVTDCIYHDMKGESYIGADYIA